MDSMTKSVTAFRFLACSVLALMLSAGCAQNPATETAGGDDASATVAAAGTGDGKICRNIRPTGSRISERVCMTAEQWERMAEQDRQAIEDTQRNNATSLDGE